MQRIFKTFLLTFISLILASFSSFGENDSSVDKSETNSTITLSGLVKDNDTGEELVCVAIEIAELNKKVFTDISGRFTIPNLKSGNYTLKVSYIAYEDKEIVTVPVSFQNKELLIQLKQL
jgi:hypothetical protein